MHTTFSAASRLQRRVISGVSLQEAIRLKTGIEQTKDVSYVIGINKSLKGFTRIK